MIVLGVIVLGVVALLVLGYIPPQYPALITIGWVIAALDIRRQKNARMARLKRRDIKT